MQNIKNKNYKAYTEQTEKSFYENRFLEAFLLQSCLIEGVLKNYAFLKLEHTINRSELLKRKYDRFGFARLLDELFITGNINKELYENLSKYKKKRNDVVHKLLSYCDKKSLDKDLREAYLVGRPMKVFIVDDMIKSRKGKTLAGLAAKEEAVLQEVISELPHVISREFGPKTNKIIKDLKKMNKKQDEMANKKNKRSIKN